MLARRLRQQRGVLPAGQMDFSVLDLWIDRNEAEILEVAEGTRWLCQMGLNNEVPEEFPMELRPFMGKGLRCWQYPVQLLPLLRELKKHPPSTYLEIGVRWGGTFALLTSLFRKWNPDFDRGWAVDLVRSPDLEAWAQSQPDLEYILESSRSPAFRQRLADFVWDLVFIDGDHNFVGCRQDLDLMLPRANAILMHDIASVQCPGVCAVWQHFKAAHAREFVFTEFIDQYPEVFQRTGGTYLGIGLATRTQKLVTPG